MMLKSRANEVAEMFSRKDRGANYESETFEVERIVVLSEVTAATIYIKEPTKKRAVAWFYFINSRQKPRWEYFFVTYSHLVGLDRVGELLHNVEQANFAVIDADQSRFARDYMAEARHSETLTQ